MALINTSLSKRTLRDPLDAFQVDQEIKEIKNLLELLPIKIGKGTPETIVTANIGAIFLRLDGGAATTFYVKESGSGVTGWVAK